MGEVTADLAGLRAGAPEPVLRAAIVELYREHQAAGLCRPSQRQVFERIGLRSSKLLRLVRVMLSRGELPDLPASPYAAGGHAAKPRRGPTVRRPTVRPVRRKPWDLSIEAARRRERERAIWGPGLIAAVSMIRDEPGRSWDSSVNAGGAGPGAASGTAGIPEDYSGLP